MFQDDDQDTTGELDAYCEKIAEPFEVYPLEGFFGIGDVPVLEIAVVWPSPYTDEEAILAGYKHVADRAKVAGDGAEAARNDDRLKFNSENVALLLRACFKVTKDRKPGRPAFPSTEWMSRKLRTDQLAYLLNLVKAVKAKHGIVRPMQDGDEVDGLIEKLSDSKTIPEVQLAPYDRSDLVSLTVFLVQRLAEAVTARDLALQDRDLAEKALADLHEDAAAAPAEEPEPPAP